MILENIEFLKAWLAKELEPICDADPTALAKYVIALVKKDKPEPDLKALCEDQLDVFLGAETKIFVASLFKTLHSKSYLPPAVIQDSENKENNNTENEQKGKKRKSFEEAEKNEVEKIIKTNDKTDVGKIAESEKNVVQINKINTIASENNNNKNSNLSEVTQKNDTEDSSDILDEKTKNDSELDNDETNKEEVEERKDHDDVSMRDISQDRSMKSMSPAVRSSKHSHSSSRRRTSRSPNRNSSSSSRHSRSSRRSRREHRDKSRERRSTRRREKEKCRDYEEKGFCMLGESCPFDHGCDPVEVDDRNLPQMLSLAGITSTQSAVQQINAQPLQIFPNVLSTHPRPLIAPVTGALTLNTGLTTVQVQKPRPIPSPMENSGGQVPIFRPRNPLAFMRNISPPVTPAPLPTGGIITNLQTSTSIVSSALTKSTTSTGEPYNPEDPSIEADETFKTRKDESKETNDLVIDQPDNRTQDELVQIAMGNIPLTPIVGSQQNSFQFNGGIGSQPKHTQLPVMQPQIISNPFVPDLLQQTHYIPLNGVNQLQQQIHIQQQQQQVLTSTLQQQNVVQVPVQHPYRKNTVLEVRKIPMESNNIIKLSEHFQKFGTITKIQTPFDNDLQGALIEFSTFQEATSAYSSPEAILGNRFIKMYWHHPNKNRSNYQQHKSSTLTSDSIKDLPKPEIKPKKIANAEELRYVNPKSDPIQSKIEKKKEVDKLKADIIKKKQKNYSELMKKQKDVFSKLEDKSLNKEEKAKLLKIFKACDAAVQRLNKEIKEDAIKAKTKSATTSPIKVYKDAKKEILDREIDIYHGNLEGEELLQAKKSLEDLRKIYTTSVTRGRAFRGRARGRSSWFRGGHTRGRGRGRGAYQSTLDNRPKQILVSKYNPDDKDSIVEHFATFGQLDRIEEIALDKMVLTFPSRKAAEVAAIQGADFNGKSLSLSWFTGHIKSGKSDPTPEIQRRVTRSLSQSLMDKDLDDELLELDKEEEEMLLAGVDDDDDDDDDENSSETNDRSWRR